MFLHDVAFSQPPPLTSILMSVFAATLSLRVKHPNILQLVDVFETKKEYFLFLELWVQTSNDGVQGFLCVFAVAHLCVVLCPRGNSYDYLWKMLREIFRCFFFGLDVGVENSFLLLFANAEKQSKKQKKTLQTCRFLLRSATGREVFDWILDQGYYSERDTSNVVRQVLEAVAYLHSLQIVHRNLKVTLTGVAFITCITHIYSNSLVKKKKKKNNFCSINVSADNHLSCRHCIIIISQSLKFQQPSSCSIKWTLVRKKTWESWFPLDQNNNKLETISGRMLVTQEPEIQRLDLHSRALKLSRNIFALDMLYVRVLSCPGHLSVEGLSWLNWTGVGILKMFRLRKALSVLNANIFLPLIISSGNGLTLNFNLTLEVWTVLSAVFQLENLVYYNRLKHSKIVISDFHLAKLENGLIKDPCGTPEYLGESVAAAWCILWNRDDGGWMFRVNFVRSLCSSGGGRQTTIRPAGGLLGHRRHHVHTVSGWTLRGRLSTPGF